ncbi:MAG: serine protease [Oscillospiraceae bacterium]|nr:serine protease [Oscillospiraceae bacterium]
MRRSFKRMVATALASMVVIGSFGMLSVSSSTTTESRTYIKRSYIKNGATTSIKQEEYTLTQSLLDGIASTRTVAPDDRKPDAQTSVVEFTTRDNRYGQPSYSGGTGFIIGDNMIVTAAHCLRTHDNLDYSSQITIKLKDPKTGITHNVYPIEVHIPKAYVQKKSHDNDYALLVVDKDLSAYGSFSLGVLTDNATSADEIPLFATGYPSFVNNQPGNHIQYTGTGYLHSVSERILTMNNYVSHGNSGGPVYVKTNYRFGSNTEWTTSTTVVGICVGDNGVEDFAKPGAFTEACRITPALLQFYYNNPNIDS